jgi:DNA-binding CsgD family transcriptional regulator
MDYYTVEILVKDQAEGYDSKRIAEKLFISETTVDNHRRKILLKTKTPNAGKALLYARAIGLI